MYESLTGFEKALGWIIQQNAPSGDFLAYLDFEYAAESCATLCQSTAV